MRAQLHTTTAGLPCVDLVLENTQEYVDFKAFEKAAGLKLLPWDKPHGGLVTANNPYYAWSGRFTPANVIVRVVLKTK